MLYCFRPDCLHHVYIFFPLIFLKNVDLAFQMQASTSEKPDSMDTTMRKIRGKQ